MFLYVGTFQRSEMFGILVNTPFAQIADEKWWDPKFNLFVNQNTIFQ